MYNCHDSLVCVTAVTITVSDSEVNFVMNIIK